MRSGEPSSRRPPAAAPPPREQQCCCWMHVSCECWLSDLLPDGDWLLAASKVAASTPMSCLLVLTRHHDITS